MRTPYNDAGYASYNEETLGALVGKEGYAVCLGADKGTIKLPTSAAEAAKSIGVIQNRFDENNTEITVSLFSKQGSFRGVASVAIAKGDPVAPVSGGKFGVSTEAAKAGRYIGQDTTADNDVIEILTK